jgi:tRNA isopentenyl-2-thiomethyl-A-37 hydroxylase MiaE
MSCLKQPTDGAWAAQAPGDVDAVLVDHAHCATLARGAGARESRATIHG